MSASTPCGRLRVKLTAGVLPMAYKGVTGATSDGVSIVMPVYGNLPSVHLTGGF